MTENHEEHEHSWLDFIDAPKLGIGILILFILVALGWNFKLSVDAHDLAVSNRKLSRKIATEVAKRKKSEQAANQSQVNTCFQRNTSGPALRELLQAIIPAVAPDRQAVQTIQSYIALSQQNTPTVKECNELARKLHVDPDSRPRGKLPS